jgi:hypothetical protein
MTDFFSWDNLIRGSKIFFLLIIVGLMITIAYGIGTVFTLFMPRLAIIAMIIVFVFELLILGYVFTKAKKWIG